MKSLTTLIKLKQRELDEKRRILVQLEAEMDRLREEEAELIRSKQREAKLASEQPEMARYFGGFAQGNDKQQTECRENQQKLNMVIEAQRDFITDAFAELKQLQIANQNTLDAKAAKEKHKEDAEMDEIGIRNFQTQEQN